MNIGLVAHDAKKKLMQNFCIAFKISIVFLLEDPIASFNPFFLNCTSVSLTSLDKYFVDIFNNYC